MRPIFSDLLGENCEKYAFPCELHDPLEPILPAANEIELLGGIVNTLFPLFFAE
jgi:hypothetical protein